MRTAILFAAIATLFGLNAKAQDLTPPPAAAFTRCAACHQPTGAGIPGAFPPLNNHIGAFAATPAGRNYLVMAVAGGLSGQIDVSGQKFMGVMPNQGGIGDAALADALNYAILTWNKAAIPPRWKKFTPAEVKAIRAAHPDWQPAKTLKLREQALQQDRSR